MPVFVIVAVIILVFFLTKREKKEVKPVVKVNAVLVAEQGSYMLSLTNLSGFGGGGTKPASGFFLSGDNGAAAPSTAVLVTRIVTRTNAVSSFSLPIAHYDGGGASSLAAVYAIGGFDASTVRSTAIDSVLFSTEAVVNNSITAILALEGLKCMNTPTHTYPAGGRTPSFSAAISKFIYSPESYADLSAVLSPATVAHGVGTSGTKGYCMGGYDVATFNLSSIRALTYAGETAATLVATLATARGGITSANSTLVAYAFSGGNFGTPVGNTQIDGLRFSDETRYDPVAAFTTHKKSGAACRTALEALICGNAQESTSCDSFLFATDSLTVGVMTLADSLFGRCYGQNGGLM